MGFSVPGHRTIGNNNIVNNNNNSSSSSSNRRRNHRDTVQKLHIDGLFFDSSAVAAELREGIGSCGCKNNNKSDGDGDCDNPDHHDANNNNNNSSSSSSTSFGNNSNSNDNDNQNRFQSREIIFRNVSIDATVLHGANELLRHQQQQEQQHESNCCYGSTATATATTTTILQKPGDRSNDAARVVNNTSIEIIHCSGLVAELIRIVLPGTERFGFTGNIPIAQNLDTEGLSVLGKILGESNGGGCRAAAANGALAAAGNEAAATGDHHRRPREGGGGERPGRAVRLKSLVLKGTRLETAGFVCFCEGLGRNTTLEDLQLSNCTLRDDDVLLLAAALWNNKSLKSVFLANCKFGTKRGTAPATTTPFYSCDDDGDDDDDDDDGFDAVDTTESINNTYSQSNLPVVLEALIGHPALQSLVIYDMYCNDRAIEAIGDILASPKSELQHLGLKNNLPSPHGRISDTGKNHLFRALSKTRSLQHLKLSGNNLDDGDMVELGRVLAAPRASIRNLCVADNLIAHGLLPLASTLGSATSLRHLDVQRNPITPRSKAAVVSALRTNVHLEQLDLDGSWDDDEKSWWLCLNRAGRRALRSSFSGCGNNDRNSGGIPASLWPNILRRASNLRFGRSNTHKKVAITTADAVYYLIRRIPSLFETGSDATTAAAAAGDPQRNEALQPSSIPNQTKHRKKRLVVKVDSTKENTKPNAKRKFNLG